MSHFQALDLPSFKAYLLASIYHDDPKRCPPVIEDMMPDINRIISSISSRYVDQSCPALHFDELEGEGRFKLAQLISSSRLEKLPNRFEAFKFVKTALNNHIKSIVYRHRGTAKRTGHSLPRDRIDGVAMMKPVEVRIDDPESTTQLADLKNADTASYNELYDEVVRKLNPVQRLVLDQLINPNPAAWAYAYMDASRGKSSSPEQVTIRVEHLALGLGLTSSQFSSIQAEIKVKVMDLLHAKDADDAGFNRAVSALESIFGVEVPPDQPLKVIRRLFTIAARHQHEKCSDETSELLISIGAVPPRVFFQDKTTTLNCFGVLHAPDRRPCTVCQARRACQLVCDNLGLGDIKPSPEVLGSIVRTPLVSTDADISDEIIKSYGLREEQPPGREAKENEAKEAVFNTDHEILSFLNENFVRLRFKNTFYYRHRERPPSGKNKPIFWLNNATEVRFCGVKGKLREQLSMRNSGYYLPQNITVSEAITLIDSHAAATFI